MTADRYALCDDTCTVDCGACKGAGRRVTAPTPPEVREAAVIEEVARAMWVAEGRHADDWGSPLRAFAEQQTHLRRLAAAAVAAYRAAQDGGAEEAVHAGIVREASDLFWKATPFTEDETGAVAAYLLPAGVVHRLIGQLQGAGYPAAFRAIAPQTGEPTCEPTP